MPVIECFEGAAGGGVGADKPFFHMRGTSLLAFDDSTGGVVGVGRSVIYAVDYAEILGGR